jgi:hypothetical protein
MRAMDSVGEREGDAGRGGGGIARKPNPLAYIREACARVWGDRLSLGRKGELRVLIFDIIHSIF